VRIFCGQGGGEGVLQMWTSALFRAKRFGIFEIYVVSARTRRGSIFRNFVRTSFMDGPLLNHVVVH